MNTGTTLFGGLAVAAALSIPSAVKADASSGTTDSSAEASDPAEPQLPGEEIVVTARRREERAQSVPVAIVALSGKQLAQANVVQIDDLARVAPGFVVQAGPFGSGTLTVTLRSQRQNLANLTYDPSVGIYFAEVVEMRTQGANASLYDLQSVQILKGPQGTLFGRNTTGGAVLITPAAPDDSWGGYIKAGTGNYSLISAEGAINVPLSDTLKVRISGQHREHGGYINKVGSSIRFDDENVDGLRASVKFEPSNGFTNTLVVDWASQDGSGTGYKLAACDPAGLGNTRTGICASLALTANAPFYSTTSDVDPRGMRTRNWTVSNITSVDAGSVTLKNIAGYRHLDALVTFDLDGSSTNTLWGRENIRAQQVSDEFQILGNGLGDRLNYIVGAYFFDEWGTDYQYTPTLGTPSINDVDAINRSYSVFGQATYKLLPELSLTAGLRQTWDERQMTSRSTRAGACRLLTADVGGVAINPCQKTVTARFNALTYNFSLDWKPTERVLVYAATRRGYRAGGFAVAASLPSEFAPYRPETVTDYEIGLKADYSLGIVKARTNIAAYYSDYRDIQRNVSDQVADPNNPSVIFTRSTIANAAKGKVTGVEVEQMIRPADWLQFDLSYAYSNARYQKFVLNNRLDYTASPFAGAPKHVLTGSLRLDFPLAGKAGDIGFRVSGTYRSSTIFADVSTFNPVTQKVYPTAVVAPYTLFDARLDWNRALGSSLTLSAWMRNLTNEKYYTAGQDVRGLAFSSWQLGQPRTFGVEARYDF